MLKSLCLLCVCLALASTGCASRQPAFTPGKLNEHGAVAYNDPQRILFYNVNSAIKRPYRVIGKSTVSERNIIGFKRNTETVHDIMRKIAASMGGDAIINIQKDDQNIHGTIILFEKAMT
ncbi:MAG TPA: hypothetical protein VHA13_02235 [Gammaproteobacteria bacterium]|nr:hypothetical protein [Gammaproteobacteria bacterium]